MFLDNTYKDIIKFTIDQPHHFFKKMQNFTHTHLQIKYASLIKTKNRSYYNTLKKQSANQMIVLNYKQNSKDHKINAMASREQVQNTRKAIKQIFNKNNEKQDDKKINKKTLALTAGTSKLYYEIGRGFYHEYSKDFFTYQYNFLWKNQQYRINLSQRKIYTENIKQLIADIAEQDRSDCLRFKDQTDYLVSKHFMVSVTEIFQTEDENIFKQYLKAVQLSQNIDDFVNGTIKKHFGAESKFEIQLKFTQQGCQHLKSLSGNDAGNFMGKCIEFFHELSRPKKQDQLTKLMSGLSIGQKTIETIQEKKPIEKKQQKEEAKPAKVEIAKKKKYTAKYQDYDADW